MQPLNCFNPVFLDIKHSYCLIFQSFPQSWLVWRGRRLRSTRFPERSEFTTVRGQRMKTTTTSWVSLLWFSSQKPGFASVTRFMCLFSLGRSHDHHVPRGTRWRVCGLFWTEQKKCGDQQLDSSTHEKVQEGKRSRSSVKPTDSDSDSSSSGMSAHHCHPVLASIYCGSTVP